MDFLNLTIILNRYHNKTNSDFMPMFSIKRTNEISDIITELEKELKIEIPKGKINYEQ